MMIRISLATMAAVALLPLGGCNKQAGALADHAGMIEVMAPMTRAIAGIMGSADSVRSGGLSFRHLGKAGWTALDRAGSSRAAQADGSAPPDSWAPVVGRWINPLGSVEVETAPCGEHLCGRISWASREALQDARDSGVPSLIGTELLRDYRETAAREWRGRVYVPDMGRTFYSTIDAKQPDILKISGCVLSGLVCRSQIWRRHS